MNYDKTKRRIRQVNASIKRDELRTTYVVAENIRRTMQKNRSKNTGPELLIRRAIWKAGMRGYRLHNKRLPGTPDIVFSRSKLAVFVHGCFWHGCPNCSSYRLPKTNSAFWRAKLEENLRRDGAAQENLRLAGFSTLTLWECEIERNLEICVTRIQSQLELLVGSRAP